MADGGIVEIMHELKFSIAKDASVENFRKEIVALKNEIQSVSTLLKDKGINNSFNGETDSVKRLQGQLNEANVQLKKYSKTIEELKTALGRQTQAAIDGTQKQNGLIQEQILLLKKAKIAAEEETDLRRLGGKNDARRAELARLRSLTNMSDRPLGDLESLELRGKRLAAIQKGLIGHKELQENISREIALNKENIAVLKGGEAAQQKINESKRTELGIIEKLQVEQRELNQLRLRSTSEDEIAMYDKRLKRVNKQLGRYGGVSGGSGGRYSIFNSIKRGFGIGAGVLAFGAAFRVYEGMKDFVVNSAKAAENLESARVSFKTMIGSEKEANDTISMLQELTKNTTFGFNDAVEYSKKLLAYGVSSKDLEKDLTSLGNIAAGVGQEKMPNLILAFGQIRSKGHLMGQELRQLTEAGFNPLEEISKRTGESMTNLYKDMSKGSISFEMVQQAMVDATTAGGRFDDLMGKQIRNSLKGQRQQTEAYMQLVEQGFGEDLIPVVSMYNDALLSISKNMDVSFNETQSQKIQEQSDRYNALIGQLKEVNREIDSNKDTNDKDNGSVSYGNILKDRQKTLISQINDILPDYTTNLDLAKASQEKLNSVLNTGNILLNNQIGLFSAQEAASVSSDKLKSNERDIQSFLLRARESFSFAGLNPDKYSIFNGNLGDAKESDIKKAIVDYDSAIFKKLPAAHQTAAFFPILSAIDANINEYDKNSPFLPLTFESLLKSNYSNARNQKDLIKEVNNNKSKYDREQKYNNDISTIQRRMKSRQAEINRLEINPYSGGINPRSFFPESNIRSLKEQQAADMVLLNRAKKEKENKGVIVPSPTPTPSPNHKGTKTVNPYSAIDDQITEELNTDPRYIALLKILNTLYKIRTNLINSGVSQDSDSMKTTEALVNMKEREVDVLKKEYNIKGLSLKQDKAISLNDKDKAASFNIDKLEAQNELANMPIKLESVKPSKLDVQPIDQSKFPELNKHLTLGDRLFGPETSVKERYDMAIGYLLDFGNEAKDIYTQIADRHISELDREISYQEFAVQEATVLANRGNVDALKLENKRLVEAEKQREQSARKEQVINSALTESYALAAVAKAFLASGPLAPVLIPAIIAALGASFGLVSVLVNNKTSSIPTFYKGGYTGDTNTHSLAGMTHGQEFVVNAANTKKFRWLLEPLNKGKLMIPNLDKGSLSLSGSVTNDKHLIMLGDKLDLLTKAVYDTEISAENRMDGNGVAQIVKKFISLDAKRFRA